MKYVDVVISDLYYAGARNNVTDILRNDKRL